MIEIIVAAALLNQQVQDWHYAGDTAEAIFGVDAASIRSMGGRQRFWYVGVNRPPVDQTAGEYAVFYSEIDCEEETFRMLQGTLYSQGRGERIEVSDRQSFIAPGSVGFALSDIVCEGTRHSVSMPTILAFVEEAQSVWRNDR